MIRHTKKLILALCCFVIPLLAIPCTTNSFERKFGGNTGVKGLGVPGTNDRQEDNLLHTIRVAINRVLGMLALVALVLCLYAGFRMMTSGGDSTQYKAGLSILKNAGIGLAIIGLSWLIVSLVFYIINGSIRTNGG